MEYLELSADNVFMCLLLTTADEVHLMFLFDPAVELWTMKLLSLLPHSL